MMDLIQLTSEQTLEHVLRARLREADQRSSQVDTVLRLPAHQFRQALEQASALGLSCPAEVVGERYSFFYFDIRWTLEFVADHSQQSKPNVMDWLRGTGRTTRMLEHAKKLSREGRAVYIIADNDREVNRLRIELGSGNHGIKVETPETVGNLDWRTMTLRGAHPNCVVLCDHHTIEDRFGPIVRMLHAFDA